MYELPLFPLDTVLFPGMPISLHIFEERYKQMLQRVLQTNQTFGINLIQSGSEALGPLAKPHLVGCTARIVSVDALEDGRYNLTAVGDERYRVLQMSSGQNYLTAFVESLPIEQPASLVVAKNSHVLRERVKRYLHILSAQAQQDNDELDLYQDLHQLELPDDALMMIYLSAALLQIPPEEKQPLLEAQTAPLLLEMAQRLYRRELAVLPSMLAIDEEQARRSAWAN